MAIVDSIHAILGQLGLSTADATYGDYIAPAVADSEVTHAATSLYDAVERVDGALVRIQDAAGTQVWPA